MKHILLLLCLCISTYTFGRADSVSTDTPGRMAGVIRPVTITAYGHARELASTPAAVNNITRQQLDRYNNTNIVQAVNATPGVKMEERSPGSYRMNVRGSTLRSPFGVRNVKIYYNDIPLTDPSGFTYLNQLGFYNISSLQIIKGPGGSIYGAGTGGVMLVNSLPEDTQSTASVLYEAGSYGLTNIAAALCFGGGDAKQAIRYQHTNSDGYRIQSALARDVISWDGVIAHNARTEVTTHFLYNELKYETPGALTLAEYNTDRRGARPPVGAVAGAMQNHAQVFQKNLLAGFTTTYHISPSVSNSTTLYGSYTQLNNPTIRNYSRTSEPHYGGRTTFKYEVPAAKGQLLLLAGGEAQNGYVYARTYSNSNGNPDTLQNDDETNSYQYTAFALATWRRSKWVWETGLSINKYGTTITRLAAPALQRSRNYDIRLAPRLAVSYNFAKRYFAYVNIANGFSPPTSSELLPTGSAINTTLLPETGWNYEVGSKGNITGRLFYDVSLFYFQLSNTIVLRKNIAGGDEYVNSGATQQMGIEGTLSYRLTYDADSWIWVPAVWLSYTGYDFKYREFVQVTTDFSNKHLPGVAPHTVATGIDIATRPGIILNLTYYFSDKTPLNDANAVYADAYHIVDIKASYRVVVRKTAGSFFVGVNNLFDQKYSLGNDINAAGGRYYNAAPGINYYAGVNITYPQNWRR